MHRGRVQHIVLMDHFQLRPPAAYVLLVDPQMVVGERLEELREDGAHVYLGATHNSVLQDFRAQAQECLFHVMV